MQKNIDEGLKKIVKKEETGDQEFYKRMVEKTTKEVELLLTKETDKADLNEARRAMEVIIKQMQMAKADRKTKKTAN